MRRIPLGPDEPLLGAAGSPMQLHHAWRAAQTLVALASGVAGLPPFAALPREVQVCLFNR